MALKFSCVGPGAYICLELPVTYLLCDLRQVALSLCAFIVSVSYGSHGVLMGIEGTPAFRDTVGAM